jgi:hypothetical protein
MHRRQCRIAVLLAAFLCFLNLTAFMAAAPKHNFTLPLSVPPAEPPVAEAYLPRPPEPAPFVSREIALTKRLPLVYTYDFVPRCFASGLCAARTTEAARAAFCADAKAVNSSAAEHRACVASSLISARFRTRMLSSAWSTPDPAKAKLFFIDFDPTFDWSHCADPKVCPYMSAKLKWLQEEVLESSWFKRSRGDDHVYIVSQPQAFEYSPILLKPCARCTKLCMERHSSVPIARLDDLGRSPVDTLRIQGGRWASFPYPLSAPLNLGRLRHACEHKHNLLGMGFSLKTALKHSNAFRQLARDDCMKHPQQCQVKVYERSNLTSAVLEQVMAVYSSAKFCVVGSGDTITRKAWIDSLAQCCIPIFSNLALLQMWLKIYSFEFAPDIAHFSLYLPSEYSSDTSTEFVRFLETHDAQAIWANLTLHDPDFGKRVRSLTVEQEVDESSFDSVDRMVARLLSTG